MTISVRSIIPRDREHLVRIVRKQKNFLKCEIDVAVEVIDATFNPAEDYRVLAAFEEEKHIHGFVSYGPIPLTENRFDLYWIAVDPASSRLGIGSMLLEEMENQLRRGGSGHIYIDTSSTEEYLPARLCYEKNGYDLVSQLSDFYRPGDDKIVYRKVY